MLHNFFFCEPSCSVPSLRVRHHPLLFLLPVTRARVLPPKRGEEERGGGTFFCWYSRGPFLWEVWQVTNRKQKKEKKKLLHFSGWKKNMGKEGVREKGREKNFLWRKGVGKGPQDKKKVSWKEKRPTFNGRKWTPSMETKNYALLSNLLCLPQ